MSLHSVPAPEPNDDSGGGHVSELYVQAVEEYRFQAKFNWSRVQYILAFNAAILAAGGAVAPRSTAAAVALFALGAIACLLGFVIQKTQHEYYRRARDRLTRIEEDAHIPPTLRFDTTAYQADGISQRVTVTKLVNFLLIAIGVADVLSLVATVTSLS